MSNASSLEFVEDITLHERKLSKEKRKQVSLSQLESHIHILEPSLERLLESTLENHYLNNPMRGEALKETLWELYELDVHQTPIDIAIPPTITNFHLMSDLISNLSIFRGSNEGEPHKHLRDFSCACDLLRPQRVAKEQLNFREFSFSLANNAERWLINLEPQTRTSCEQLKKRFSRKKFPIIMFKV